MDKESAWNYALGLIKVDGLTPSDEMLKMIEMEKQGKITTEDIIKRLNEKYSAIDNNTGEKS